VFNVEVGIEFNELIVYELSAIISYDRVWHAIAAYNIFPDKLLDLLSCDGC